MTLSDSSAEQSFQTPLARRRTGTDGREDT